jgi:autophagy-related protein 18
MNRSRLVVCLKDSIYIHNIQDMRLIHSIKKISENPNGLISLSSKNFIAYPVSKECGRIQLVDINKMQNGPTIEAHSSRVVIMKFSLCGEMIATASEKGTVIRIFSVISGQCLMEFRRSVKRYAQISSLSFSLCGQYVTVSSNTETIHIFKLHNNIKDILGKEKKELQDGKSVDHWKPSIFSSVSKALSGVLFQDRDYAHVQLMSDSRKHCVIAQLEGQLSLVVACEDGFLYIYKIDDNGGECHLKQVHDLRTDLDFARIGGSESLEALDEQPNKTEILSTVVVENESAIAKSTYAEIMKKRPANDNNSTDEVDKTPKNFPIGHDNFTYDEGFPPVCRA